MSDTPPPGPLPPPGRGRISVPATPPRQGKPGESRGHKATGPRLLRDAAVGDATKDPRPPSYRTGWLGGRFFFGGEPFRDGGSADEELPWNTDERDRPPDSTHQGS